jgi:chromosome segregation ATPase
MSGISSRYSLEAPAVDWLFAQVPGGTEVTLSGIANTPSPDRRTPTTLGERTDLNGIHSKIWTEPPDSLKKNPDLQDAYQWLLAERQRLEEYTRKQFASIQSQHQTLLSQHFRNEETLALRSQELNREMAFFAAQAKAIQERARGLSQRERTLSAQTAKLSWAQSELRKIQDNTGAISLHPEIGRILEELQAESARLSQSEVVARAEFEGVETALKERQQAWELKQTEITQRIAQMDKRYQDLEKAEDAARRRLAEMEELEIRLEQEFEKQERQLAIERREIERLRTKLRMQGINPDGDADAPVAQALPAESGGAV